MNVPSTVPERDNELDCVWKGKHFSTFIKLIPLWMELKLWITQLPSVLDLYQIPASSLLQNSVF